MLFLSCDAVHLPTWERWTRLPKLITQQTVCTHSLSGFWGTWKQVQLFLLTDREAPTAISVELTSSRWGQDTRSFSLVT